MILVWSRGKGNIRVSRENCEFIRAKGRWRVRKMSRSEMTNFGWGFGFFFQLCGYGYLLWCFRAGTRGLSFSLFIENIIHLVPTVKAILFNLKSLDGMTAVRQPQGWIHRWRSCFLPLSTILLSTFFFHVSMSWMLQKWVICVRKVRLCKSSYIVPEMRENYNNCIA